MILLHQHFTQCRKPQKISENITSMAFEPNKKEWEETVSRKKLGKNASLKYFKVKSLLQRDTNPTYTLNQMKSKFLHTVNQKSPGNQDSFAVQHCKLMINVITFLKIMFGNFLGVNFKLDRKISNNLSLNYWVGGKVLSYFGFDENILLYTRKNVITFYTDTFKRFWWKTHKIHAVDFSASDSK